MAVYVDDYRARFGRMVMGHMMADTLEELHAMAAKINVARKWFQLTRHAHYDVCQSKRQDAIRRGAVAIRCGSDEWQRVKAASRQQAETLKTADSQSPNP